MALNDNFSAGNTRRTSLDFAQLRAKGLSHLQHLSGDIWTDYNAHDPGVTILEQLCYALTDIAYRTSLPIQYFLAPFPGDEFDREAQKNAFFVPSDILSSPPVTIADLRKVIINEFEKVENAWLTLQAGEGYQEQLRGTYKIELLPKQHFRTIYREEKGLGSESSESDLLSNIKTYLGTIRNIGEDFSDIRILEQQDITIDFDIYVGNEVEIEITIAHMILALFEYIYHPVHHYSFEEMQEAGQTVGEIFDGPKLDRGFIKNEELRDKLTLLSTDGLEQLFLKVKGIKKCQVRGIKNVSEPYTTQLKVLEGKFFSIFHNNPRNTADDPFDSIFQKLNVFGIQHKVSGSSIDKGQGLDYDKDMVKSLLEEIWAKHHREYDLKSQDDFFNKKLKGYYKNPNEYQSIQNHFPLIYGIGKEKLPKGESAGSIERKAQALQLKAYLLFFEKHLANHLSQLGNMNEFFNIFFNEKEMKTYYTQPLDTVPEIEKIRKESTGFSAKTESGFFQRKHRIYDHLLARFGETLNELPWKIKHEKEANGAAALDIELLKQKSEFLKTIGGLVQKSDKCSYSGIKGEDFSTQKRIPSGLEQLLVAKTGIPPRVDRKKTLSRDKTKEGLFILDHILLRNLIDLGENTKENNNHDLQYGFSFRDQFGNAHFETKATESWCNSIEERKDRIDTFFRLGLIKENYIPHEINGFTGIKKCDLVEYDIDAYKQNIHQQIQGLIKDLHGVGKDNYDTLSKTLNERLNGYLAMKIDSKLDKRLLETIHDLMQQLNKLAPVERTVQMLKSYMAEFLEKIKNLAPAQEKNNENSARTILASYDSPDGKQLRFGDFYKDTRRYIQLFDDKLNSIPRIRWQELEKKRKKGSRNKVHQKRLVFQRKVSLSEITDLDPKKLIDEEFEILDNRYMIIDEDFFDQNISIILPNTPSRFTDQRFKNYVVDLIGERTPAHIANEILWLNTKEIRAFEKIYVEWEKLMALTSKNEMDAITLRKAAFQVYRMIRNLKTPRKMSERGGG